MLRAGVRDSERIEECGKVLAKEGFAVGCSFPAVAARFLRLSNMTDLVFAGYCTVEYQSMSLVADSNPAQLGMMAQTHGVA